MQGPAVAGLLLAVAAAGVAYTQPRVARTAHAVKEGEDVYAFPPPVHLRASVLGWSAATVDLLWADLLVEYGTHWSEHRDFTTIPQYVDAILELEPTYQPLYRYVDTLLAYRPMLGTERDVKLARGYLERGTRERPDDAKVWNQYGQFLAFIGPSFLHDEAEKAAWRRDGAEAIGHVPSRWGRRRPRPGGGDDAHPGRLDGGRDPLPRARLRLHRAPFDDRGPREHRASPRGPQGHGDARLPPTRSARASTPGGRARCLP